ncbi:hypothetical protein [Pseudomonas sp. NMI760_13]|uniref:hypothetical protein n=1 Tax=Pseudomonas sp. NMI760_13 TaxID=2903147 RepID=UPI001E510C34|nr:hypothetical protein [Pseudomonas sp. NMI760_13]MCE0915616.1 hypothetical protein [Pseudomonas sp. NMI760_13]
MTKKGIEGKSDRSKGVVRSFIESMPAADYVEMAVDAFVGSEALKDVPVVGSLMGVLEFRSRFKRRRFLKRVEKFYSEVSDLSSEELKDFDESFESSEQSEEFVTDLIELIDRLENEQKALMLAGAFKRLVRQDIDKSTFTDMSRVFDKVYNIDLFHFMHGYKNPHTFEDSLGDVLVSVRVCKRKIENSTRQTMMLDPSRVDSFIKVSYEVTGFGRLVLETLHEVYAEKIDPEHLIRTEPGQ